MKWHLSKLRIKDLLPNEKNPRKISTGEASQLQSSLEKFGMCEPIVVNCDGTIIGGHQRLRILSKMGTREVDVYIPDTPLSQKEAEELTIRLNKSGGSWDYDALANCWDPEELVEWGFTLDELHLESLPPTSDGEDEKKPSQKCTMNITFKSAEHLQEAENEISTIVDRFQGASYKVKIK